MNFGGPHVTRREILAGGAIAVAGFSSSVAFSEPFSEPVGFRLTGSPTQGGLVIGRAMSGVGAWVDDAPVRVADGLFCFGFGWDAERPVAVRVAFPDGHDETAMVMPSKRNFPEQRINGLPTEYVTPDPEQLARIARDAKAVAEARAHDSDEIWFTEDFVWPADGPITGIYGSHRVLNGEPREAHYGVDIASPAGTPIHAPIDGVVSLAEYLFLSGNTMIIDHGHGVSTSYLHMSHMDVKPGDRLRTGQQIGLIGATGRATGPHLCWRMNWFQTRLDVALVAPPRANDKA